MCNKGVLARKSSSLEGLLESKGVVWFAMRNMRRGRRWTLASRTLWIPSRSSFVGNPFASICPTTRKGQWRCARRRGKITRLDHLPRYIFEIFRHNAVTTAINSSALNFIRTSMFSTCPTQCLPRGGGPTSTLQKVLWRGGPSESRCRIPKPSSESLWTVKKIFAICHTTSALVSADFDDSSSFGAFFLEDDCCSHQNFFCWRFCG